MFADKFQRCQYANPQLKEVICQLRFPTILSINEKPPADFQEAIREEFPLYRTKEEKPAPKLVNGKLEQGPSVTNYSFISSTGIWKINLTQNFIALSTLRYNNWEDFARRLDRPLAEFIRIYRPAFFDRMGLRYVNIFSRQALGLEDTPWRELFQPTYLGLLADPAVDERTTTKNVVDAELHFPEDVHLKLHAGPGMLTQGKQPDPEPKFIFDIDFYANGQQEGNQVVSRLELLHDRATRTFRGAITEELHQAMGPEIL